MSAGKPDKEQLATRAEAALTQLFGNTRQKELLGERRTAGDDPMRKVAHYLVTPLRWGVGELTPQDCALKMAAALQTLLGGDIPVTTASPTSRPGQVGVGPEDTVFVAIDKARLLRHPAAIDDLEKTTKEKLQIAAQRLSIDVARDRLAKAQRQRAGLDASGNPIRVTGGTSYRKRWAVDRESPPDSPRSRGR